MSPGQDVWVKGYNGPKQAVFEAVYLKVKKVLVVFHEMPEVVDEANVFESRAACYRAWGLEQHKTAMSYFSQATDWLMKADEQEV